MINILKKNWNNIKNTWKGIKSFISLKTKASSVPAVLSRENGDTITNPYDIAYAFNNYFASIAETLLFKMRKYASPKILRSIYFAIFDFHLSYCCLVWAQNFDTIQQIVILQKKAIRIINFQPSNCHTSPLFKQNSILKFQDKICLENILFFSKSLNDLSPSIFNTWFSFSSDQHSYETSSFTQGNLMKIFYKTNRYGKIQ